MASKRTKQHYRLGTDPDSDRVGIAVKGSDGSYQLVTGNQVGALLMSFILKNTDLSKYSHPAIVKTIVTSELGADIARKQGINVFSTLTGFKFIGEKITQFEQAKLKENAEQDYDFLFGYVCLNSENGIEVENRNVEAYAMAIKKLANNEELRKKYGMAGKQRVEENFLSSIFAMNISKEIKNINK